MNKIRILIAVDKVVPDTGPHRNVHGTVQALARREDVSLQVLCGEHALPGEVLQRVAVREGFRPHRPGSLLSNAAALARAARECDVIYVPSGLKSFLYAWALKGKKPLVAGPNVAGIPYLMHVYDPTPLLTTSMADAWVEMSQVRVEQCVAAGTRRERIHLVPHSVDVRHFSPQRRDRRAWERYGIPADGRIIIHTGRFDSFVKGVPVLLESFRIIREAHPDAVLVLVGPAQIDPAELSGPGVFYLGPKYGSEFATLLASADLFLGASRYETFWFCPLEAMSCGLPAVVSEVGAVRDLIPEDGVQGRRLPVVAAADPAPDDGPTAYGRPLAENRYRFLPDAAAALARAAIELLDDPEKMAAMGEAARAHVATAFTEEALAERLVGVFRSVAPAGP